MFWIDRIADDILKTFPNKDELIVRDEKTLSGQVHVGSLRGVVIHGVIAEALRLRGRKARFIYEFNDADPMDGMPAALDAVAYAPHMGKPLHDVPSPADREYQGMHATNLAEYYGLEFLKVIHDLGFKPEITWAYELYQQGFYDEWIRVALKYPKEIRAIYKRISNSDKPEDWMPLQVICENCGKIGSTTVIDFDGELATYRCEPDKVEWAKGCGHQGKVAPWRGRGKLPWKVEWPVKWASYKVDIEGAGKDHAAASGSHDVAEAIIEEVLKTHVPYDIPYEFFLFEGAKMSSSKGNAASAKAVTDLLPPEVFRFLMIMKEPNQPIEFSPDGETIPRLFDRYDEAARHYFLPEAEKTNPDLDRMFFYSQLDPEKAQEHYLPRFSKLVFWSQIPHVDVEEMVAKDKGDALTELDSQEIQTRLHYIKTWLENFAPERYLYKILPELPDSARALSPEQKNFLKQVAAILREGPLTGEEIHGKIHTLVKNSGLKPADAFPAIYQTLMGKEFGPQVGWFLEALDRDFVIQQMEAAAASEAPKEEVIPPFESPALHVESAVLKKFPGIKSAWVHMTGLHIGTQHPLLTEKIAALVGERNWEEVKDSPRLEAFKQMYRDFGANPNKNKPSPVMLVDRLAKGKDFPRVNDLVDAYNYLCIKHQISAGAFNAAAFQAPVILRFARKGERFQGLGDKERTLEEGELCYFDSADLCMARDFNHLDADQTKITPDVTDLYLNLDAAPLVSADDFKACIEELVALVQEVCGGTVGDRNVLA